MSLVYTSSRVCVVLPGGGLVDIGHLSPGVEMVQFEPDPWCSACKVGLAERDGLCPGCEGWTMPDGRLPAAGTGGRVPVAVAAAPDNRATQADMVAARDENRLGATATMLKQKWSSPVFMVPRGAVRFLPAGEDR